MNWRVKIARIVTCILTLKFGYSEIFSTVSTRIRTLSFYCSFCDAARLLGQKRPELETELQAGFEIRKYLKREDLFFSNPDYKLIQYMPLQCADYLKNYPLSDPGVGNKTIKMR